MANPNPNQTLTTDEDDENDETTNFLQSPNASLPTPNALGKTMAFEDSRRKTAPRQSTTFSTLFQHLTTTAHACILLFVILIIYFCFSDFQFFTWHPLLLSIGWMFLMTEAILSLSKESLFTGTLPKGVRVRLHWIFQAVACTLITIGFIIVFVNKNYLNKEHFKSWHGLLGFIGIVSCIPTCLNGIAALYGVSLRHYIRPKINKFIHVVCGVVTFAFGGISLILSVYTKWFARHSNDNVVTFVLGIALVSISVGWTLVRPMATCFRLLKHQK